ncbi:uncharacterized protein LOC123226738 [Mangifera indica]|uniref:uncharacterized protein LOC123226738 n=1 Tax=Mangifera indica TaxID=29780 RepID=UPI001CFBD74D|nr:uncharacterized protein LOC123226738 [Mangifera indica]
MVVKPFTKGTSFSTCDSVIRGTTFQKGSPSISKAIETISKEKGKEKVVEPIKSKPKVEKLATKSYGSDNRKDSKRRICVAPPQEVAEQGAIKWNTCVVGFFLGKRPPFLTVKRALERMWTAYGLIDVMTSGQGVIILKFLDKEGVSRAVEEGQLTIQGQPFLIRKWTTNLPMVINDVKKVAIWVKLYAIPLEFWAPKGLSYIANAIGNLLYMDSITEEGTRLEYARVCIEIKVDSECPEAISLALPNGESMVINVEYAWKPIKCNGCQCFGHSTASCSLAFKQGNDTTSRNSLKEVDGFVLPMRHHGKDKMAQVTKGYDKKTKDKVGELQKPMVKNVLMHKSNRFFALAIKES